MDYEVKVKLSRSDGVCIDPAETQECARELVERAVITQIPRETVSFKFVGVTSEPFTNEMTLTADEESNFLITRYQQLVLSSKHFEDQSGVNLSIVKLLIEFRRLSDHLVFKKIVDTHVRTRPEIGTQNSTSFPKPLGG